MEQKTAREYIQAVHALIKTANFISNAKRTQKLSLTPTNITTTLKFLTNIHNTDKNKDPPQTCKKQPLQDKPQPSIYNSTKHSSICSRSTHRPACSQSLSNCQECPKLPSQGLEEIGRYNKNLTPLNELKDGKYGKIRFIRGEHNVLQRLLDMGLTPGTQIKVVKIAPMGGPVEVSVRGSKLALGQDIARNVFVEAETATTIP
ncbi:MAG: ferrous iron transport protein A [Nitrososphaerota archaeon]|jgi:DtxR family Mn-dependent transcriptional regulator|nr:ferrous iron transport protein A [Nitrososphaerota archaeon]